MAVLSDFVEVNLGFKSFLNDFFYVDRATVEKFGIEDRFLKPLFMLADLDEDSYVQSRSASRWLFNCQLRPADIAHTGAGRYVNWGSHQTTEIRKQTKEAVRWPKAPALSHLKHWYWPAAPVHPARLAVRKGIGSRYAPFVFNEPAILDQRLYLLFPKPGVDFEIVAAYLASSLFPLSVETNADMGPGAGVLTLGTDALRDLPVLDLRKLSGSKHAREIRSAGTALFGCRPVDADLYPSSKEIHDVDEAILSANGSVKGRAAELARQVATLAEARIGKSRLRSVVRQAAKKADLKSVAEPIVKEIRVWFLARRFPEDYAPHEPVTRFNLPVEPFNVNTEILLGQCELTIRNNVGVVQYHDTLHTAVAEVILRALQLSRRNFAVPTTVEAASRALDHLDELVIELEHRLKTASARTGLGSKYDDEVLRLVLDSLGIQLWDLNTPFASRQWAIGAAS